MPSIHRQLIAQAGRNKAELERDIEIAATRSNTLDALIASTPRRHPMRCRYCGLALSADDPGQFHPICKLEVGPLHSCPDCGARPCPACTPEVSP